MPVTLKKLVDTKLLQKKITPDDARDVLERVKADKKFSKTEVEQLKRLTSLPAARFEKRDEYIPNPNDPEDGVTIKADPKKWLENTVQLATASLTVKSSIPELSVKLSSTKEFEFEDFGSHLARTLDFSYGSRNLKVEVKEGEPLAKILNKLESAIIKKEGSISVEGWYDESKSGKQTIKIEVL